MTGSQAAGARGGDPLPEGSGPSVKVALLCVVTGVVVPRCAHVGTPA